MNWGKTVISEIPKRVQSISIALNALFSWLAPNLDFPSQPSQCSLLCPSNSQSYSPLLALLLLFPIFSTSPPFSTQPLFKFPSPLPFSLVFLPPYSSIAKTLVLSPIRVSMLRNSVIVRSAQYLVPVYVFSDPRMFV